MGKNAKSKAYKVIGGRLPGKTNLKLWAVVLDEEGDFEKDSGGLYKWAEDNLKYSHWRCPAITMTDLEDEQHVKHLFEVEFAKPGYALPCFTIKVWMAEDLRDLIVELRKSFSANEKEFTAEKLQRVMAGFITQMVHDKPEVYGESPMVMWNLSKLTKVNTSETKTQKSENPKPAVTKPSSVCTKCPSLTRRVNQLEEESPLLTQKIKQLEEENPRLSQKIKHLEKEKVTSEQQIKKLEEDMEQVKSAKEFVSQESTRKIEQLTKEKEDISREKAKIIEQLEKEKDAINRENVDFSDKIDNLTAVVERLTREKQDIKSVTGMSEDKDMFSTNSSGLNLNWPPSALSPVTPGQVEDIIQRVLAVKLSPIETKCAASIENQAKLLSQIEDLKQNPGMKGESVNNNTESIAVNKVDMDVKQVIHSVLAAKLNPVQEKILESILNQEKIVIQLEELKQMTEDQKVSVNKMTTSVEEVQKELDESLHRPSLESIMKKLKKIADEVKAIYKSEIELGLRFKDSMEEIRKVQTTTKVTINEPLGGKDDDFTKKNKDEAVKFKYEMMPESENCVLAGDRIVDIMKMRMADATFDLLPKAKFVTSKETTCGQFVTLGSYGPMLKEVTSSTQILVISVGRNDLLEEPALLTEAKYSWVEKDKRNEQNKKIVESVTERVNVILQKVTEDFPELKVFYITPPPSVRESELFIQFRGCLKKLEVFQKKVKYIDIIDELRGITEWEVTDFTTDPGCLTYPASRLLMNMTYSAIFPQTGKPFCGICRGIHVFGYCPGQDSTVKPNPIKYEKDTCWFCFSAGHKSDVCPAKKGVKARGEGCLHCGSNLEQLDHHPDMCLSRFYVCEVCDQAGHRTEAHFHSAALKKVHDRIGYNLIVKTIVDPKEWQEENAAKRRKISKGP